MVAPTPTAGIPEQSNAKQVAHAPQPALRSADPEREPMPVAGRAERPMPDARGPSPGAPKGNRNALKHGRYTAEAIRHRREISGRLRAAKALLRFSNQALT